MKKIVILSLCCVLMILLVRYEKAYSQTEGQKLEQKQVYLPSKIYRVPEKNNFDDKDSEFSHHRKAESKNIAVFWAKEYGDDPKNHVNETKRFDPEAILAESERFYAYYRDKIKMVEKGNSLSDQYKLLFFVIGGEEGTAFGGGAADSIGVMWASSLRIQTPPYGAVAHEMAHCFQYLAKCDGNWAYSTPVEGSRGNSIFEMTAQYMLWQVYPEWLTFENYHLQSFMEKAHYAFLHETNMYHAAHVLEYWSGKHGVDFVGRLWRESVKGEDPVMTYKRLVQVDQKMFNDEIFEAYRRFITWDMPRIEEVARPYANLHFTKLEDTGEGWYTIAVSHAPQNYGYNGIRLDSFTSGATVELDFKGIAGAAGYRAIDVENAGWRYGFVAYKRNGERVYGDIYSEHQAKVYFNVPEETEYLWLVVSGAPQKHTSHLIDGKDETDEQWPYQIKLTGAHVAADML